MGGDLRRDSQPLAAGRSPGFFYEAFRVIAWKWVYYQRKLEGIDTDFDECPVGCDEPKERDGYCEDCPVGGAWRDFRGGVETELGKRGLEGYDFDSLYRDLTAVRQITRAAGDGVSGEWTVSVERMVDLLRYERQKARRIDEFNERQERERRGK